MTPQTAERTAAQPPLTPANGRYQVVDLEAAEHVWESSPGNLVRGDAYNAAVPGPVIEATVGDTLLVRFTNRLHRPTAVHWHGLRLPAPAGGVDPAAAVAPGDTVAYQVTLPDAGTFSYHAQRGRPVPDDGLYGAIVVRDPSEPRLDGERVLVVAEQDGVLVLNGLDEPQVQVVAGQVERWRLVNASRSRCVRLSVGSHRVRVLASSGGLLPAPQPAHDLVLAPGDRYDLAVGPFTPGRSVDLEALPDAASGTWSRRLLATVVATDVVRRSGADLAGLRRDISSLAGAAAGPHRLLRPGQGSGRDSAVPPGEPQTWELVNDTATRQPFHLHGAFFQVLTVDGRPPPYRSWQDTTTVPPWGAVRIAWVPDGRPTRWTYAGPC